MDSPVQIKENTAPASGGAQEGAFAADGASTDPNLSQVTTAWADLPDYIRAAILTLVNSAKEAKG